MHTSAIAQSMPKKVLVLSKKESTTRKETTILHALGIPSILHQHSAGTALAFLESNKENKGRLNPLVDLILCDDKFENQLIFHFLLKLARNTRFAQIPFLLVTSSKTTASIAEKCGISTIVRPYTKEMMEIALAKAISPLRKALNIQKLNICCSVVKNEKPGDALTKEKPQRVLTTSDIMQKGLSSMHQGNLEDAEQFFLNVLHRNEDHVEANLALAKIYRARKDSQATTSFLLRAAAACQRNNQHEKATAIRALLPENLRTGSVFQQEALAALRIGDFRTAALGYLDYCEENPEKPLYAVIARACQMTKSPYESLVRICNAYDQLGKRQLAEKIRNRLIAEPRSTIPVLPSWLDNFPRLREVVDIATYTAWAWRQA